MADYWEDDLEDVDVEDMFVGALLGGAIGDTLGCFCEGWTRDRILAVEGLTDQYQSPGQSGRRVDPTGWRIYRRYPADPRPC